MADALTLTLPARPDHPKWDDRDQIKKMAHELKEKVDDITFQYDLYDAIEKGYIDASDTIEALKEINRIRNKVYDTDCYVKRNDTIYMSGYFKGYSDALEEMQAGQI